LNKVTLVARNLWRKLRDAFTTVTVKISETKIKRLTANWKKFGEKFNLPAAEIKFRNIRTAYGRYLKRLKTLPSGRTQVLVSARIFCDPRTDVFDGLKLTMPRYVVLLVNPPAHIVF